MKNIYDLETALNEAVETAVLMDEIIMGLKLVVMGVDVATEVAMEPKTPESELRYKIVVQGMELVIDKVDTLLEKLYSKEDEELIDILVQETEKALGVDALKLPIANLMIAGVL